MLVLMALVIAALLGYGYARAQVRYSQHLPVVQSVDLDRFGPPPAQQVGGNPGFDPYPPPYMPETPRPTITPGPSPTLVLPTPAPYGD